MTFTQKRLFWAAGVSALTLASPALAEEQQKAAPTSDESVKFSTGINYSTGKYGDIKATEVISAPIALRYKKGNFRVRVSTSYIHIDGPASLLQTPEGNDSGSSNSGSGSSGSGSDDSGSSGSGSSGSGSSGSGSSGSGSSGDSGSGSGTVLVNPVAAAALDQKRSGFGDVVIAATYSFDLGSDFYFDVTGKAKLPTASTVKRLGTGKFDFTAAADLIKDIGPASIYIHGRRKFAGSSVASPVRDSWGAGFGGSVRVADGVMLGADYDWQQSAFAGKKASSDATGWLNFRLAKGISMTAFASTGLNSSSADFAGGLTLSFRLD